MLFYAGESVVRESVGVIISYVVAEIAVGVNT